MAKQSLVQRAKSLLGIQGTIEPGDRARDKISGFQGIVTSKHHYLNGCVRYGIEPDTLDDKGAPLESRVFDEHQVELLEKQKVGAHPDLLKVLRKGTEPDEPEMITAKLPGGPKKEPTRSRSAPLKSR